MGRALELEDLYRLTLVSDPVLSPDGTSVAYLVTAADEDADANQSSIWLVATMGDAPPRRLTNGPGDAHPRWTPDGRSLLFLRAKDGKRQVWRLPIDGGEPEVVTSIENGVSSFALDPTGTRLAISSLVDLADEPDADGKRPVVVDRLGYKADGAGLLKSRRSHLFVVAVDGGDGSHAEPTQLTEGDYSVGSATWSPDGTRLAFATAKRDDRDIRPGSAVYTVAAEGGDHVQHTDDTGTAAAPQWLDDDTLLYAGRTDGGLGHTRLYTLELGGEPKELTPGFDRNVMLGAPAYPGSLPRLTDDHILFCARDRGCTHVYRVVRSGGTPERVIGDKATTASSITVAGDRLAYVTASPTSTGDVAVAGVDGDGQRTLTSMTTASLDGVELAVPVERSFTAPDGTEVHGWVLQSSTQATGPTPLLLDVHGGPHNAWNPAFDGIHLYHQVLAAQGWTILFVNPRGSDGYGEDFYTAVIEGWGTADLDDFLTPIQVLVDDGTADPTKLAVTGYSYGGFMTCWLTSRTDRFAAAVTGGCVTNQVSLFGTSDLGWYLGAKEIGGTPTTEPKRLHEHSPITYVGDVTAPTLVLHGESDDRCPIEQAEQWFASLRAAGVPTRMVRYPGGSHLFIALGRPSHRLDYNRRVVEWLNEHVPIS